MRIAALKRWHWVAVALAIGLAHGWVRQSVDADFGDRLGRYPVLLTDAREFERALVTEVEGHRLFKDVTVYPHDLPDGRGGRRRVHLVTGYYWDGRPQVNDGQYQARWEPACFVAPMPYRPQTPPPGAAPEASFDTVTHYLTALRDPAGVRHRYAWWWWAGEPMFRSVCVSLILVAGVWPTVVNVLCFGSLTRPGDAPGFSPWALWRTRRPPLAQPVAHRPSDPDALRRLEQELEQELERNLAAHAVEPADGTAIAASHADVPRQPAPRTLSCGPPDAPAPAGVQEEKEFGASKEDFYPTELHARSGEPTGSSS